MNRPFLLTTALVLAAAIPLTAHAQSHKKSLPVPAPTTLDCLKGVRAHAAMMRAQPLALPLAVVRAPQAAPPRPWAGSPSAFTAVYGGRGEK